MQYVIRGERARIFCRATFDLVCALPPEVLFGDLVEAVEWRGRLSVFGH